MLVVPFQPLLPLLPLLPFLGYWMGVDPLDGGDSRRGLVRQQNGTFALAGRDTFFTLCDNTDRGFISFEDGVVVGRGTMRTDNLKITCLNTGVIVLLKALRLNRRQHDGRGRDRTGRHPGGHDHLSQDEPGIARLCP
jgi:hypothetical protein